MPATLGQSGEVLEDGAEPVLDDPPVGAPAEPAEEEVLLDGHGREHRSPLGDEGQSRIDDVPGVRRQHPAVEQHPALVGEQTADGLEGGGLARAVGADEGHDLPVVDPQVDAVEGPGVAVGNAEGVDVEHQWAFPR